MRTLFVVTLLFTCILACDSSDVVKLDFTRDTWVALTMRQCLGNPWERDWLNQDGNEYSEYPIDINEQTEIARDYYYRQEIELIDLKMCFTGVCACTACSCCSGYTLWLYVPDKYLDTLIDLGYRKEDPPEQCLHL